MLDAALLGVRAGGDMKLKDIEPQLTALAGTFEKAVAGQPAYFSWRDAGHRRRALISATTRRSSSSSR